MAVEPAARVGPPRLAPGPHTVPRLPVPVQRHALAAGAHGAGAVSATALLRDAGAGHTRWITCGGVKRQR